MNNFENKIFRKKRESLSFRESTLANFKVVRADRCNLEVNSEGELFNGLQSGFEETPIIFNGGDKTIDEIKLAIQSGAKAITLI